MSKTVNDLTAPRHEAKSFDKWFDSLPRKQQDKLRDSGVIPYREMVQSRHVFRVEPEHPRWSSDLNAPDPIRVERDEFISREQVGIMLKSFIDALAVTNDMKFRRHVELIRWALRLPGRLPAPHIARMFGITKQALHKRASAVRLMFPREAIGGWAAARKCL